LIEAEPVESADGMRKAGGFLPFWPWFLLIVAAVAGLSLIVPPSEIRLTYSSGGRSTVSRVNTDLRSVSTAIEAYMVDNNMYVASASGDLGVNRRLPTDDPARHISTFRAWTSEDDKFMTLTTPVSYITSLPRDPFARSEGTALGYYNAKEMGWILFSCGPDGDYDVDPLLDYDPAQSNPMVRLVVLHTYDPTNGAVSDGDIWRVKQ
jgi:hypothetical protein